jgi:superoxide reductase
MTSLNQIWKCEICGNVIEVTHVGADALVCCSKPMDLQKENTVEASKEKHIPVVEETENGIKVTLGSIEHPMEEAHLIEWIELVVGKKAICRHYLSPGDKPIAEFKAKPVGYSVRAYCNLHGLWKA